MERRLRACVELQATETGDLAFMYCVEARPGAGYSPMFGMSLPMEEATFFKRDVERLLDDAYKRIFPDHQACNTTIGRLIFIVFIQKFLKL